MDRPLKIIQSTSALGWGGAEKILVELSNELFRRGHYVEVWTRNGAKLIDQLDRGVISKTLPFLNDYDLYSIFLFWKASKRFDIIHTHLGRACKLSGIASAFSNPLNRNKYIAHMHSYHKPKHYEGHKNILCISKDVENYVNQNFHWNKETWTIYNGISLNDTNCLNPQGLLNIDHENCNEMKIGLLATFKWEKGHIHLLESFRILLARFPYVRLYLAGDGPLRSSVEQHALDLGISESVNFVGFVEPENVFSFWEQMDIACFPSLLEGLPLAAIEAISSGCPIVYYGDTGLVELVAEAGIMVPWGDKEALASALGQLISSRGLRNEMSDRSIKRSREFSIENMISQILDLYSEILGENNSSH